jgi:hypothetical protein
MKSRRRPMGQETRLRRNTSISNLIKYLLVLKAFSIPSHIKAELDWILCQVIEKFLQPC